MLQFIKYHWFSIHVEPQSMNDSIKHNIAQEQSTLGQPEHKNIYKFCWTMYKLAKLCIFLKFDAERNCFQCSIYDHRPALCMLSPFRFESLSSNRIALKFIPCCMGLNNPDGKPLDENFVSTSLLEPLLETMLPLQNDILRWFVASNWATLFFNN